MTTHPRARAVQAGALTVLTASLVAALPGAALAAPPGVQIIRLSEERLGAGDVTTVRYRVTNVNQGGAPQALVVAVTGGAQLQCTDRCAVAETIRPGESKSFSAKLTAAELPPGQSATVPVTVNVSVGGEAASASRNVTVQGEQRVEPVSEVSGRVRDGDGDGIGGANVQLRDATGRDFFTTTSDSGRYTFTSTDDAPISPGDATIGAAKQGYKTQTVKLDARAGRSVSVNLTLPSTATPSPSATASTDPADEAPTQVPSDDPVQVSLAPAGAAPAADDEGGINLFQIVGGLLVLAGIGGIVFLVLRMRATRTPPPGDPVGASGRAPTGPAPFGGDAAATRITRADDATVVAPAPAIADAPTMLHQAVAPEDEFPDPYGAPRPAPGTFNTTSPGTYGAPDAYGSPAGHAAPGSPVSHGTPGSPVVPGGGTTYGAAAVPPAPGRATPPGVYNPAEPDGPYGGGYGARPAFDDPPAFNDRAAFADPHDGRREAPAYGAPAYDAPDYDAPDYGAPGYGAPNYGAPGYGAPAPYGQHGPDRSGDDRYDDRYDERTGVAARPGSGERRDVGERTERRGAAAPAHGFPGPRTGRDEDRYDEATGMWTPDRRNEGASWGHGSDLAGSGGRHEPGADTRAYGTPAPAGGYVGGVVGHVTDPGRGYAPVSPAGGGHRQADDRAYGSPGGGVDGGNAYGAPAPEQGRRGGTYGGGTYGAPAGGSRPDAGGYDRYPSSYGGAGYGEPRPEPPVEPAQPGHRKPLGWLDD